MKDSFSHRDINMALNRRSFLKASAGSMAFLSVSSAFSLDALAQDNPALVGFEFFTAPQAETISAIAEQIWPTTDDSPGGQDAGVVYYIDHALAGPYEEYQSVYRVGLDWLDGGANEKYGQSFRRLDLGQQQELLTTAFEGNQAGMAKESAAPDQSSETGHPQVDMPGSTPVASMVEEQSHPVVAGLDGPQIDSLQAFMDIVRKHTMEGLFSDPIYNGNRDFAGWKAVGYPGPYYIYTEEEQQSFEPLDKPFQSIADL